MRVLASAQQYQDGKEPYGLKARVRITTRCMWVDHGKLLNVMQTEAQRCLKRIAANQPLSVIEKEVAQAIRGAVRKYSNKRPDVVVIAYEGPWAVEEASISGRAEEEVRAPGKKGPKLVGGVKDRPPQGGGIETEGPSVVLARALRESEGASGSGRGEASGNGSGARDSGVRAAEDLRLAGTLSGLATRLKRSDAGAVSPKRERVAQRMTATATLSPDGVLELSDGLDGESAGEEPRARGNGAASRPARSRRTEGSGSDSEEAAEDYFLED